MAIAAKSDHDIPHSIRLEQLLGFLRSDPKNKVLLADAASTAFDERSFDLAKDLLDRYSAVEPLPPRLLNLKGLIALAQQDFAEAAAIFETLQEQGQNRASIRFNLAWAKAMTEQWEDALALLDDDTLAASLRAPQLKIQAMHHLERYDEALAEGERLAQRFPDNQGLMGALATLAMDAEKPDLARTYAERAGEDPEGQAALGLLTLEGHDTKASLLLFDQALAAQPSNPRAWIGRGLALMISGDAKSGAAAIDKGAELFGDHLGSWIASGWAHFVMGDYQGARASFERSLAIDPNFAESHGGIAVLDIIEGHPDSGAKECEIALRLDKNCFGGALAKSMLLERAGNQELARKVRGLALSAPIGPKGQTIAQAMLGFSRGRK